MLGHCARQAVGTEEKNIDITLSAGVPGFGRRYVSTQSKSWKAKQIEKGMNAVLGNKP